MATDSETLVPQISEIMLQKCEMSKPGRGVACTYVVVVAEVELGEVQPAEP